jgi:hypothetical protein
LRYGTLAGALVFPFFWVGIVLRYFVALFTGENLE